MKLSPEDKCIQENIEHGFLGNDNRSFLEIIDSDKTQCQLLELDSQLVAQALTDILRKAIGNFGNPVVLNDNLKAIYHEAMGHTPCPWPCCGMSPKGEVEIIDSRTKQVIRLSPLSVHLIAEHEFFQGRGSRYRIEVAMLRQMGIV